MPNTSVKAEARRLIDMLPDDVMWDELIRFVCERRTVEQAREEVAAGRFVTSDELREKFGVAR